MPNKKKGPSRRLQYQGPPEFDKYEATRKRKEAPTAAEKTALKAKKRRGETPRQGQDASDTRKSPKGVKTPMVDRNLKKGDRIIVNGKPSTPAKALKQNLPRMTEDRQTEQDSEGSDAFDDFHEAEDEFPGIDTNNLLSAKDVLTGGDSSDEDEKDEFSDIEDEEGENGDFLDTDDEQGRPDAFWSDDDDSEDLNAANVEGVSRQLDAQAAREAAEAQAELEAATLQTNIIGDRGLAADSDDRGQGDPRTRLAPDLQMLRTRITDTIRILDTLSATASTDPPSSNAKSQKPSGTQSRAEYLQQLLSDISVYYGYSEFLAEKLFSLFPPREAFAFFEANETPRPIVIRTNTLRTSRRLLAQSLINRNVTLEPAGKWTKVGLQVFESGVPLGATPEYLAGQYMIQAASSFLPVMALAPQEDERILDMAAAPGGKTTYAAAMMRNTGVVFANDSNRDRAKALIGNIHRMGVKNTIVCNYDAQQFPKVMGGFDRVLLDAPCSGTGVISKDASVKTNKTEKDFLRLPHLQKNLLLAAIDSVDHKSKTGGVIVYSTCSVTVEENEQVVQYALSRRPNVKIVDSGLTFGKDGFVSYMGKKFDPSMKLTKRYYPHAHNLDGFFVCKFKKTSPLTAKVASEPDGRAAMGEAQQVDDVLNLEDANEATAVEGGEPALPIRTNGNEVSAGKKKKKRANGAAPEGYDDGDPFGDWSDEEGDAQIIERERRRQLRKKGLNPKAVMGKERSKNASKGETVAEVEKSAPKDAGARAAAKVNGSGKSADSALSTSSNSLKSALKRKPLRV